MCCHLASKPTVGAFKDNNNIYALYHVLYIYDKARPEICCNAWFPHSLKNGKSL